MTTEEICDSITNPDTIDEKDFLGVNVEAYQVQRPTTVRELFKRETDGFNSRSVSTRPNISMSSA